MTGWKTIDNAVAWINANSERWFIACLTLYLFICMWGF